MTTTLARRLDRAEEIARARRRQRWEDAKRTLFGTLAPEHRRFLFDWMGSPEPRAVFERHGHTGSDCCFACLLDTGAPTLVRAAWMMLLEHMQSGSPVALPPHMADIYLGDPDALPMAGCDCRYPLPVRARIRRVGPAISVRYLGVYESTCPVCGDAARAIDAEELEDVDGRRIPWLPVRPVEAETAGEAVGA
jgi:hypothetical protein